MSKELTRFKDDMADLAMKAKSSALAMAAPLSDDTVAAPASKTAAATNAGPTVEQRPAKPMPVQKAGLLKAMLAIGDLQHSIFLLSRFYWISGPHPEVADLLCRLLHVSIEPAYSELRPSKKLPTDISCRLSISKARPHPPLLPEQTVTLTAEAILPPSTLSTRYEYFYLSWKDQVPICASLDHVLETLTPLLKFIGLRIHRDVLLVTKLCRIGVAHVISSQSNPAVMEAWMNMVRQYLLPALSQLHANPGIAYELWRLLELYPYQTRYGLYGEWKESLYKMYPEMKVKKVDTEKESKGILRRISKDNVKQFGRMLAKLSHSNPTILFTIALDQIQAYDNLVGPVVDATRYLTAFGYDVLPYIVLESLSNPMKNRTKQDGTNASLWLASLASFTGTLLRKYNNMDPTTIVQYVANQLKAHNTKDLIVLNRLLTTMAGIDASLHLSDLQLSCLSGGEILKTELLVSMNPTEKRANLKRSSGRLLKSLLDSDLAIPLLILTAQQMQVCIYNVPEEESHLKALASLYDTAHVVFVQYVEFLVSNMTGQEYSTLIPSLESLMINFGLESNVTFHLARPKLAHDIRKHDEVANEERLRGEARLKMEQNAKVATAENTDSNDGMVEGVSTPSEISQSDVVAEPKDVASPDDTQAMDVQTDLKANGNHSAEEVVVASAFHPALSEAIQQIDDVLPEEVKNYLTPNFYLSFWRLGLGDISVPMKGYSTFIDTYHAKIRELDSSIDPTPGLAAKRKRDKERLQHAIAALNAELKKQLQIHEASMKRLKLEKDQWFIAGSASNPSRMEMVTLLMQHCIQPRAIFSPNDAIYTAKFIRLMHSMGTRHFSSLTLYDRILGEGLSPILFSLTENEAHNYARFLQEILRDFASLQSDQVNYNREGRGKNLPGFAKKWGVTPNDQPVPEENLLTYEEFRHVLYKWHRKMYNAFKQCFESKEYMHIRNAIIVLQSIPQLFPKVMWMGQKLTETITELIANETREDLKLLATGYQAILKKHKSTWIPVYQFHDDPGAQKAAEKAAAKRPPVPTKPVAPPKPAADTLPPKPAAPRTANHGTVNGSNAPSPRRNAPQSPMAASREPPKGPAASRDERDMPSPALRASDRGPLPPRAGGRGPVADARAPRDRRDVGRDRDRERERPRSPRGGSKRSREGSPDRASRSAAVDSIQRGRDERVRDDRERRPHGRDGRDTDRERRNGREREVRRDGPRTADAVDHKRRREDSSSSDKRGAEGTNGVAHDDKRRKTDDNANGAPKAIPATASTPAPAPAPNSAEEPKIRSLSERMGKESGSSGRKIEESGIQAPSSAPKRLKIAGSASASPGPLTPTTPQGESPKAGAENLNRRPAGRDRDGRASIREGGNRDRSGPRGDRRGPGPRASGNRNGRRH